MPKHVTATSLLFAAIFLAGFAKGQAQPGNAKGAAPAAPIVEADPMFSPPRNEKQPAVPNPAPSFDEMIQHVKALNKAVENDDATAFDAAATGSKLLNFALTAENPSTLELIALRCRSQCLEMFRIARREGARLNALGIDGNTPRHWAVIAKNPAAIEALNLLKVASVPDAYGFKAEYYAAREDGYAFYTVCREFRLGVIGLQRQWKDDASRIKAAQMMINLFASRTTPTREERFLMEEGLLQRMQTTLNSLRSAMDMAGANSNMLCERGKGMLRGAGFVPLGNAFACNPRR